MNDGITEVINEREKRMHQAIRKETNAWTSYSSEDEEEGEDDNDDEDDNDEGEDDDEDEDDEDENGSENDEEYETVDEDENEDEDKDSDYEREYGDNTTLNDTAVNSNELATSINESTTVFDDRLETTLNNRGRYARLGSTGKFYCGDALDGPQCNCCDGKCGPTGGCNCSSCMLLDLQKRALPRGWLVNRDGASARCSRQMLTTFYCGRRVMPDDGTSDGYCGPTNGPQCTACQILNQQRSGRYNEIWIGM
ncbi:unnamed protein product [Rotaria sp. Silwood1]|nr:unnamed protein product [Rotaria sp. Silwood1]CAF4981139.1 unnamed protein product [Rotaria sp. Silwood1]CAF5101398.1 unnamed protein product [Rotaria sp. Silwood1]